MRTIIIYFSTLLACIGAAQAPIALNTYSELVGRRARFEGEVIQILDRGGVTLKFVTGETSNNVAEAAGSLAGVAGAWKLQNWNGDAKAFGAVDGASDSSANIRDAISYGGIAKIPSGTFNLTKGVTNTSGGGTETITYLRLTNNMVLSGEGIGKTILTVGSQYATNRDWYFASIYYPEGDTNPVENIVIRGITFDGNLSGNAVASSDGYAQQAAFQVRAGKNILIEDCEFRNFGGYNVLIFGSADAAGAGVAYGAWLGTNATVRNCIFRNCGSVTGNTDLDDHSTILATRWTGLTIENCQFINDSLPNKSCTAIEADASNVFARGNVIENVQKGIIVSGVSYGTPATNLVFESHVMSGVLNALQVWNNQATTSKVSGLVFRDSFIKQGNYSGKANTNESLSIIDLAIQCADGSERIAEDIVIENNIMIGDTNMTSLLYPFGTLVGRIHGVTLRNNRWRDLRGYPVSWGTVRADGRTSTKMENEVWENVCVNPIYTYGILANHNGGWLGRVTLKDCIMTNGPANTNIQTSFGVLQPIADGVFSDNQFFGYSTREYYVNTTNGTIWLRHSSTNVPTFVGVSPGSTWSMPEGFYIKKTALTSSTWAKLISTLGSDTAVFQGGVAGSTFLKLYDPGDDASVSAGWQIGLKDSGLFFKDNTDGEFSYKLGILPTTGQLRWESVGTLLYTGTSQLILEDDNQEGFTYSIRNVTNSPNSFARLSLQTGVTSPMNQMVGYAIAFPTDATNGLPGRVALQSDSSTGSGVALYAPGALQDIRFQVGNTQYWRFSAITASNQIGAELLFSNVWRRLIVTNIGGNETLILAP